MSDDPIRDIDWSILREISKELIAARDALGPIRRGWVLHEPTKDKYQRVTAVLVILEDVLAELKPQSHDPWRTVPWMTCAADMLELTDDAKLNDGRAHIVKALDRLLANKRVDVGS